MSGGSLPAGALGYDACAQRLLETRLAFAQVHAPYLHLTPQTPSRVLDVGAGPGHDAAALAEQGHHVVAVEPTRALREGAARLYRSERIAWLDDSLPHLELVHRLGTQFDFILLSGVWMHLTLEERNAAMPRLRELMAPSAKLALSLRHGPAPPGRRTFQVGSAETRELARSSGLATIVCVERESIQNGNRAQRVTWTILAFEAVSCARG